MSGCTTHRAYVYDRGGMKNLGELFPLTRVKWARERDEMSVGNILAHSLSPTCDQLVAEVEPGRHELVVFRNGKRVWEGPIQRTEEKGSAFEVDARDITHYLNRTAMRSAYSNAYPNIVTGPARLQKIIATELARKEAQSPPINVLPYLDVRVSAQSARTARSTKAYASYVYEELESMAARSGIDYTVVGRRLIINDTHESIGQGPALTDNDFIGDLAISSYGSELATVQIVTDGQGRAASVRVGSDSYYGEVELLTTAYQEAEGVAVAPQITLEDMTAQAQRNASGRYPTPVVLRVPASTTLDPRTADDIMDYLVPGVRFMVRATRSRRKMQQLQKLDRVAFEETEKGEEISVTLTPAPGVAAWQDAEVDG